MVSETLTMEGKTVLVTGANSGIGKATATALAQKGATVYMVCRNRIRGEVAQEEIIQESGNPNIHLRLCDLSSIGSIKEYGTKLREELSHIDVLINNAGAIFGSRQLTLDGLECTFALNHVGYFLLTHYLLDLLRAGSMKRIVNVASIGHRNTKKLDFANLQSEKGYKSMSAYYQSKLFNIYFTRSLARSLAPEGITVNCLHPGVVSTNFGNTGNWYLRVGLPLGRKFMLPPEKGASTSIYLASSPQVEGITGEYFDRGKASKPSKLAQSDDYAQKIWDYTMSICTIDEYGVVE